MRIITIGRTVVAPVSVLVLALAGISAPPAALAFVLVAVGALGLVMFAMTSWRHRSSRVRAVAREEEDGRQIAKDEASDLVRMGSDAG